MTTIIAVVTVAACAYGILGRGLSALSFIAATVATMGLARLAWLSGGPNSAGSEYEFGGLYAAIILGPVIAILGFTAIRLSGRPRNASRPKVTRPAFR